MSGLIGGGWFVIYRGKLTTTFSQFHAATAEDAARHVLDEIITGQAHHLDSVYVIPAENVQVFRLEGLPSLEAGT